MHSSRMRTNRGNSHLGGGGWVSGLGEVGGCLVGGESGQRQTPHQGRSSGRRLPCEQTNTCENITFLILRMRSVKISGWISLCVNKVPGDLMFRSLLN